MSSLFSPKSLTPIITHKSAAPFPIVDFEAAANRAKNNEPAIITYKASGTETVQLQVCSEFVNYSAPVTAFASSQKLGLVVDGAGQPMALSVAEDKRLRLVSHVNGGSKAWQMIDITPKGAGDIITFDVSSWGGQIFFAAAAAQLPQQAISLYTASIPIPTLAFDQTTNKVTPDLSTLIKWKIIENKLGDKVITQLSLSPARAPNTSGYQISVGTSQTSTLAGSHYLVNPSSSEPWKQVPLPEAVTKVHAIQGANTADGNGSFILYQRADGPGCTQEFLDDSGNWSHNIRMLTSPLGSAVYDLCANVNPNGKTDLFIAGDTGIGHYPSSALTAVPTVILKDVSFKQVVSSESIDKSDVNKKTSIITIFALSQSDELYHIVGRRNLSGYKVKFTASGFPIRSAVARLSCFYNGIGGASELLYASANTNSLRHLVHDQQTGQWNENIVSVPSLGKTRNYPAYATSITCTNSAGQLVPEGYTLKVSSSAIQAVINDMTINLSAVPIPLRTDSSGKVYIVIPTDDALGGPTLNVQVVEYLPKPETFNIFPAQRIMRGLASIQSSDDLISAKSSRGATIFPTLGNSPDGASIANSTADLLSNFPSLVQATDPGAAKQVLGVSSPVQDGLAIIISKNTSGQVRTASGGSWWNEAVSQVDDALDDAAEWLKQKAKKVLKVGFRILAKALEFVIEIGGKILKFVVKAIGPLLRSIVGFLKDYLGIDLTGLLEWLGFIFDVDEIKKTQQVLKDVVTSSLQMSTRFFEVNRSTLQDGFEGIRTVLQPILKDTRPPKSSDSKSSGIINNLIQDLQWIIQNPIVQHLNKVNPMRIILEAAGEAATEEFADLIKLPSMDSLEQIITKILPDLVTTEIDNILRFFQDIFKKIEDTMTSPADFVDNLLALLIDGFWTVFDATEGIALAMYDILVLIMKQIFQLVTDVIKIPLLTTTFTVFAEQDFSVLNCATFVAAGMMNVIFSIKFDKLPFEVLGDPRPFFGLVTNDMLDLHAALGIPKPVTTTLISDSTIQNKIATSVLPGQNLQDSSQQTVDVAQNKMSIASGTVQGSDAEFKEAKFEYGLGVYGATTIHQIFNILNSQIIIIELEFRAEDGKMSNSAVGKIKGVLSILANSFTLTSRITNVILMNYYMSKSPAFEADVAQKNYSRAIGLGAALACNIGSLMVASVNYHINSKVNAVPNKKFGAVSGVLLPTGDLIYQICNYWVIWDDDVQFALAFARIFMVDVSSIFGVLAGLSESKDWVTLAVVANGAASPMVGQLGTLCIGIANITEKVKKQNAEK